jgi:cytochrome P450
MTWASHRSRQRHHHHGHGGLCNGDAALRSDVRPKSKERNRQRRRAEQNARVLRHPGSPYLQVVVNEVLRWRPVSAGGILHAVTKDDEYMGYRIPAGATVIGNHWAIHLNEDLYQDPYSFNPDRWIKSPNLPLNAFRFSRRVSTGQHIARNSLLTSRGCCRRSILDTSTKMELDKTSTRWR